MLGLKAGHLERKSCYFGTCTCRLEAGTLVWGVVCYLGRALFEVVRFAGLGRLYALSCGISV